MHVDIKPNLKRYVRVPDGNRSRDPIAGEILYHVIIIIIIKKKKKIIIIIIIFISIRYYCTNKYLQYKKVFFQ